MSNAADLLRSWYTAGSPDAQTGNRNFGVNAIAKAIGYSGNPYTTTQQQADPLNGVYTGTEYGLDSNFTNALQGYTAQQTMQNGHPALDLYGPNGQSVGQFATGDGGSSGDTWGQLAALGIIGAAGYGALTGVGAGAGAGAVEGAAAAGGDGALTGLASNAGWSSAADSMAANTALGISGSDAAAAAGGAAATGGSAAGGAAGSAAGSGAASGASGMADWADWAKLAAQVGSTALQSGAASSAAGQQAAATQAALAEQQRQFDLTRSDYAPYRQAGVDALGQLQTQMKTPVTSADVMQDPGYQFGLDQGRQAIDRKVAAAGGRISGAALKGAARFGADYATSGYNSAYQRRQDSLNRLAALAGIGQTATAGSAAAGTNAANQSSSLISSQGDATAASTLAQGNIWGSGANALASLYGRQTTKDPNAIDKTYGLPNYAVVY